MANESFSGHQHFLDGECIVKVSPHDFTGGKNMRIEIQSKHVELDISMPPEALQEIVKQSAL